MGRAAGAGDDGLQAARGRAFGVGEHFVGHAVGRDDPRFVGDAELLENRDRVRIVSQSEFEPITTPT